MSTTRKLVRFKLKEKYPSLASPPVNDLVVNLECSADDAQILERILRENGSTTTEITDA